MPIGLNRWGNTAQDREFRNKTNENWDKIENTYTNIDNNSKTASDLSKKSVEKSNEALNKANEANRTSESVQSQLDTLVISGDSSVEAAQARVDTDNIPHNSLKERVDNDFLRNNIKIEQDVQYRDHIVNVGERPNEPIITFVDDDGNTGLYTRLYPIFRSKGKRFTASIITNTIGHSSNYVTLEQLKEMQKNGLETLSHCYDAPLSIAGLTPEQQEFQLRESQRWLKDNGFEHEGFTFPQNDHNLPLRKLTRKYYRYAFSSGGLNDKGYLEHSHVRRIGFGSFMTGEPNAPGISDKLSLEYYKYWVDQCLAKKCWLVFTTHVAAQSVAQDSVLAQLIDYIDSLGIKIVTPSEGFRICANKLNVGDEEEKHLFISSTGQVKTNINDGFFNRLNAKASGLNNGSPIYSFIVGATTVISYTQANNGGFPTAAGTLHTIRVDKETNWEGMSYQTWTPHNTADLYKRAWNVTKDTWDPWKLMNMTDVKLTTPVTTVGANTFKFVDLALTGAVPGVTSAFGYPIWGLPGSVTFTLAMTASDKIRIVLQNISTADVVIPQTDWLISYRL
ncbi:polysaccharide deacetylase family protein [Bacillus mycoides]|uniref:polysaccharide deacetylase family protein n=1 Tax=Bacillus mycoides TaxID=1405 RepID=UPI00273B9D53|nr:polysaccharide deacetylase family protein [Bacillus mycoides]